MRRILLAATVLLAGPVAARAQAAAMSLPRAYAGYSQPVIAPSACQVVSAAESRCVIPAMTAGRYLIEAAGTSTSQGAGAKQGMEITVGAAACGIARPANPAPWPSGVRTFRIDCEVTILTDTPLIVRALYGDVQAVKDPRGPSLSVRPLPWEGVTSARMFAPTPPAPMPAPAARR